MAAPVFGAAGTGSGVDGNIAPAYPSGITANMLLVLHAALAEATTRTAPTISGWTQVDGNATSNAWAYAKKADGSETGTVAVTRPAGSAVVFMGRIYRFSADWPQDTTTWANNFESWTGAASAPGPDVSAPTVITSGPDCLAVCLGGIYDNNAAAPFTGESGGDWTEPVAEFLTTAGADGCLFVNVATMASAGTLSGGTTAAGGDAWSVLGFAIKPPAAGGAATNPGWAGAGVW